VAMLQEQLKRNGFDEFSAIEHQCMHFDINRSTASRAAHFTPTRPDPTRQNCFVRCELGIASLVFAVVFVRILLPVVDVNSDRKCADTVGTDGPKYSFTHFNPDCAFLVPADPGSPGQRAVKRVCVS